MDLYAPLAQPTQTLGKQFFALFADEGIEVADGFESPICFIGIDDFRF